MKLDQLFPIRINQLLAITLLSSATLVTSAYAALINIGGGMIYDDVQDITWLQDANYAYTSGYSEANAKYESYPWRYETIMKNGRMGWDAASTWAEQLTFGGYDDWRLPTINFTEYGSNGEIVCNFAHIGTDCGYNVLTSNSELAYMFNVYLGLPNYFLPDGSVDQMWNNNDSQGIAHEIILNLVAAGYWTHVSSFINSTNAGWYFDFSQGTQFYRNKNDVSFAWAVRDGRSEVPSNAVGVPEPASLMIFCLGVLGLICRRGKRCLTLLYNVKESFKQSVFSYRKYIISSILLLSATVVSPAQAGLINLGNGMIYDDVLDVTWLQDANYAKTSGYDDDGRMNWNDANAWAAGLEYEGYADWRLATVNITDTNGNGLEDCDFQVNGQSDCGFNVLTTNSELAYMFFVNLKNISQFDINGNEQSGWDSLNTNFTDAESFQIFSFENMFRLSYWTNTEYTPDNLMAWNFDTDNGMQYRTDKDSSYYVWAVRDGRAAVPSNAVEVPEPASFMVFSLGIAGLLWRAWRPEPK